ncbi:hypothetical protein AB6A40_009633 [Gnathostoma spinigerum]|uniref:Uncharacterized protein n=1 Tax=Gnathostoma spinigerum TaxID=75299 RepID=A0ABD6EZX2_9BILA
MRLWLLTILTSQQIVALLQWPNPGRHYTQLKQQLPYLPKFLVDTREIPPLTAGSPQCNIHHFRNCLYTKGVVVADLYRSKSDPTSRDFFENFCGAAAYFSECASLSACASALVLREIGYSYQKAAFLAFSHSLDEMQCNDRGMWII